MLQTFWTSFNIIEYTTIAEIFYKKSYQSFRELNLKAEDYRYLSKLLNIIKYYVYDSTNLRSLIK